LGDFSPSFTQDTAKFQDFPVFNAYCSEDNVFDPSPSRHLLVPFLSNTFPPAFLTDQRSLLNIPKRSMTVLKRRFNFLTIRLIKNNFDRFMSALYCSFLLGGYINARGWCFKE
jgi:hypothetical protein